MNYHLVVTHPWAEYGRGDVITDPETVKAILAGEHARDVVKIAAPEPQGA